MKVHLRVFVEIENLGKAMNALSDAGITGFYILEYKGMSPQDWKGFVIKEDPKSTIGLIRDYAKDAVLVCSVVDEEKVDKIVASVRLALEGEKYTILEVPIRRIIVSYGDINKKNTDETAEPWIIEEKGPCLKCGEDTVQKIIIDKDKAQIRCNKCGTSRFYDYKSKN
jgi:nitrogen regulatory protein PII-like uncharacterized protein/DNA-directed RNA polymerase subunit RPC12/RpoP